MFAGRGRPGPETKISGGRKKILAKKDLRRQEDLQNALKLKQEMEAKKKAGAK